MKSLLITLLLLFLCFSSHSQVFKIKSKGILTEAQYQTVVKVFQKFGTEKQVVGEVTTTTGELYLDIVTLALLKVSDQIIHMRYPFEDANDERKLSLSRLCVVRYLYDLSTNGVWIFNMKGEDKYMTLPILIDYNEGKFGVESWFKQIKSMMVNLDYGWNFLQYMNGIIYTVEKDRQEQIQSTM